MGEGCSGAQSADNTCLQMCSGAPMQHTTSKYQAPHAAVAAAAFAKQVCGIRMCQVYVRVHNVCMFTHAVVRARAHACTRVRTCATYACMHTCACARTTCLRKLLLNRNHAAVGSILARLVIIIKDLRWRCMLRALPSAHGCTVARAVPSTFKASRPRRSGRERPLLLLRCRRGCCCTGVCSLCLYLRMCRLVSINGELINGPYVRERSQKLAKCNQSSVYIPQPAGDSAGDHCTAPLAPPAAAELLTLWATTLACTAALWVRLRQIPPAHSGAVRAQAGP